MGTLEDFVWCFMAAICVALFVGGVAAIIAMVIEVYAADFRRVQQCLRQRFGAHFRQSR